MSWRGIKNWNCAVDKEEEDFSEMPTHSCSYAILWVTLLSKCCQRRRVCLHSAGLFRPWILAVNLLKSVVSSTEVEMNSSFLYLTLK